MYLLNTAKFKYRKISCKNSISPCIPCLFWQWGTRESGANPEHSQNTVCVKECCS